MQRSVLKLTDLLIKVLRPTRHQMGHFGDVLPSQSRHSTVHKKLNRAQQKEITQEQISLS